MAGPRRGAYCAAVAVDLTNVTSKYHAVAAATEVSKSIMMPKTIAATTIRNVRPIRAPIGERPESLVWLASHGSNDDEFAAAARLHQLLFTYQLSTHERNESHQPLTISEDIRQRKEILTLDHDAVRGVRAARPRFGMFGTADIRPRSGGRDAAGECGETLARWRWRSLMRVNIRRHALRSRSGSRIASRFRSARPRRSARQ